jgi:hypothetical protein
MGGFRLPTRQLIASLSMVFDWTSQSLRKGVASAAYAIGARLTDVHYARGWSTNSTVLKAKYIDFTLIPSLAA